MGTRLKQRIVVHCLSHAPLHGRRRIAPCFMCLHKWHCSTACIFCTDSGSTIEKGDGEGDAKLSKKEQRKLEDAEYDAKRFTRRYKQQRRINWVGTTVFSLWIFAFFFYMFIRVTKTLQLGSYIVYGIFVLGVEVLGASTTLIYGARQPRACVSACAGASAVLPAREMRRAAVHCL